MRYLDEIFEIDNFTHMCAYVYHAEHGSWPEEFLSELPSDVHVDHTSFDHISRQIALIGSKAAIKDLEDAYGWTNPFA